jgi:penicillin V acylase-like amidase (Ntn superfamily)
MKRTPLLSCLLVLAATDVLPQQIDHNISPSPPLHCTSFVLDNNGYAVFGSNFDYAKDISEGLIFVNKRNVSKSLLESDSLSKHISWTSKYGSVSFNLVTSQAAFAGMNEAGLVISLMGLRGSKCPQPDKRPWIHSYSWMQYVLDNFSTVEEVTASDSSIRIVGRVPPYFVPHYLLSDAFGNCATIEFLGGKMVSHSGRNLPVKVLANTTYDRSISEWKRISVLKKNGKPVPRMNPSLRRFIRAAERVSSWQPTDSHSAINTAFDILDEVSGQKVNGAPTRWSIVFDTKDLRIHFTTIVHSAIREIDLHKLDFSCESPVKMMGITERLSGDITRQLKSYSFKLHLDHALKAREKWGMEESPEELEQQIRAFDEFPCTGHEQ